jgi:nucleoid-associated protein YgaU
MTPRLKQAIERTAEFSGASKDEVADMAAANLESAIAQAEKSVKAAFKKAINKVHIGPGARKGRAGKTRARSPQAAAA